MDLWTDKDLNDDQIDAVENDNNVFLVACPGSGKTRTLTYKIAYELSKITSLKKRILAITYTNAAANEIHERIESMGIDTTQLWIGTIHSFCLEWIIKPYGVYHSELKFGFRLINSHDTEKMLSELCITVGKKAITHYDCEHYFDSNGKNIKCTNYKRDKVIATLNAYHEQLSDNRQVDFELILWYSYQLISQHPAISKLLSNIFSYILIDEYQDTKNIMYHILASIWSAGNNQVNAFVVGDPNQAIFTSLGGYPIRVDELSKLAQLDFQQLELTRNYRNSERIVNFFSNFKVYGSQIFSYAEHKAYNSLVTFDTNTHKDNLAQEIKQLIDLNVDHYGISPNEICIVGPWWIHLASLTRRLVAIVPNHDFNGPGLTPFVRDPENIWYKVARLILTNSSPRMYVRRMRWATEIILFFQDAGVVVQSWKVRQFIRFVNSIDINEKDGLLYLKEFFVRIFQKYNLKIENYNVLVEHRNAFFDSSHERIQRLIREGYTYAGNVETFRRVFRQKSGITVSTIHGVKGAEFDTVIAFGILNDVVPHFNELDKSKSAKRLLYVIGSRARKNLHLIAEHGRNKTPTLELASLHYEYD
ncbi:UvrD-helicase domain-containing protein [Marinicella marina]|uniref:UvrD-helicase domain-containing protein n=1 Tax=Marinicella marina TaxID=2996016 RepID=UPI0024BBF5CE|nr:ATP-dependent helicase [Marinicella marina]MDJ1138807.1 ATP-dependent helicase [Marinicella marina]